MTPPCVYYCYCPLRVLLLLLLPAYLQVMHDSPLRVLLLLLLPACLQVMHDSPLRVPLLLPACL